MRLPTLFWISCLGLLFVSCYRTDDSPADFRAEVLGTINVTFNVDEDISAMPVDSALLPDMRCPCEENNFCPELPLRCSAQTLDNLITFERFMQASYGLTNNTELDYQHLVFYAITQPDTITATAFSELRNANGDALDDAEADRLRLATGKRIEGTKIITDEAKDNLREVSAGEREAIQNLVSDTEYRVLDQAYLATNTDNTATIIPANGQGKVTFSLAYTYNADADDPYFVTVSFLVVNVEGFE